MIQSHFKPYKSLEQHINEVDKAASAISSKHSNGLFMNIDRELKYTILFHDLGKAIPEFQKYIANPNIYRGKKADKAHSPISLLLWVVYAQQKKIDLEIFLLVASIVWRHHGDFPTFEDFSYSLSMIDFENFKYPFNKINIDINPDFDADEIDIQDSFEDDFLMQYDIEQAAELRLKAQFIFSILIEADRTFLALSDELISHKFKKQSSINVSHKIVDDYLLKKIKNSNQNKKLNNKRTEVRNAIINNSLEVSNNIESVTLPTGLGKTLIAAEWALKHRAYNHRKVIIVLPFLSIIDQTVKEYKNLLQCFDPDNLILESHSISERKYVDDSGEDANSKINDSIDFLADTWNNDFIITTFDQFIYALLSSKNNHILKFHNLADSLIIMDEIQALPTTLWQPLSLALNKMVEKFNSKILIMSATQPGFLKTNELFLSPEKLFAEQNRYKLILNYKEHQHINTFIEECIERIEDENWDSKRVLIVLNTRASARKVLDRLENYTNSDVYFLSADVTPKERIIYIEKIKKNKPCLVIATQCIEAGVDIDMDFVIRDIAPLDSIIQCAGRCNRNGLKQQGNIEIVSLKNQNNKLLASFVYDNTLLEKTKFLLSNYEEIQENEIYALVKKYFSLIKECKDTGLLNSKNWAYWKEKLNVKKLLRGDNKKHNFVVVSQDTSLKKDLSDALEIDDRWKRKRKIKTLKARITKITVSVWANKTIIPEDISEQLGCFYLLKDEFYTEGKGITLRDENITEFIL